MTDESNTTGDTAYNPIDPFRLRDSAGNLDPIKCATLARTAPLTDPTQSGGAVASDAMIEIAEVVVPGLVAELTGRQEDAMDQNAERTMDEAKEKHLSKIIKALERVDIIPSLQTIKFVVHPSKGSRDDPIEIVCKVNPEDWGHVPELTARLNQIRAAKNND